MPPVALKSIGGSQGAVRSICAPAGELIAVSTEDRIRLLVPRHEQHRLLARRQWLRRE